MFRLGRHFAGHILRSIAIVTFLFFCLVALIELVEVGNRPNLGLFERPLITLASVGLTAISWAGDLLPISILVGSVLALIDLQNNRELIVAKSSGVSIWGILAVPAFATLVIGIFVSYAGEVAVLHSKQLVEKNVGIIESSQLTSQGSGRWIKQQSDGGPFFMRAKYLSDDGLRMRDVSVFKYDANQGLGEQIVAQDAEFVGNAWQLIKGTLITSNGEKRSFERLDLIVSATKESISLQLGSVHQMNIFTLRDFIQSVKVENSNVAAALMRLRRAEALPALLVGSLLIAFAFTVGYRRHGTSGSQVLYGIVLGFVLYVVTKLLERAGSSGVMDATLAAWGPAIVAIVIGTSVLLWKEDG
ncbi:LptF/LptG family permease [Maritalea porphyrae]|uniref:LptF/LptG family permease n=1 Tax=Maritalea porphyrae TaxID=880732 RepID=UPI0022AEF869|nr:LptF/LptG family permease [Maritalea porphyrae]MCZ4270957.1 LptF/LptG family permease [Maritalea porphyrae]